MIPYPKRLIEVDLPIKKISEHARREKSIRHGHISTLHIWWARRPLAACRAVICAALWPDPADQLCPEKFRRDAAALMKRFFDQMGTDGRDFNDPMVLRGALLDFIADFANWDNSTKKEYLETSRALTQSAHEALGGAPGTKPLVVDPFAGGGSIPLEALRVGADATGFEEDARLTAMWLWTLSTGTNGNGIKETENEADDDENTESSEKNPKISGYVLEYDAARKIAQGLGAHLEQLTKLVEIKGDKARLLPIEERTAYLFGKEDIQAQVAPPETQLFAVCRTFTGVWHADPGCFSI